MYTIKAVTSLTGLNAETLRAWERRYGAVIPERDGNGRRMYSHENIERFKLLNDIRLQGHSIGKIAGLTTHELEAFLIGDKREVTLGYDKMVEQLVEALTQYRLDACDALLRRGLIAMDPLTYAEEFLLPGLRRVGELWHQDKITIAQEHMFSNCVKRIVLSMVHNMMPLSGHRGKLIFTTLSGEHHEFGILLACLLAANQRCFCYYLGSDLPSDELVKVQQQLKADVILLSVVNSSPHSDMLKQLLLLVETIDHGVDVWVGGAGAENLLDNKKLISRIKYIPDLKDFNSRLKVLDLDKKR